MDKKQRNNCGRTGRDWICGDESNMSAKGMSRMMSNCIDTCLEKWTPRKRFTMFKIEQPKVIENPGVIV